MKSATLSGLPSEHISVIRGVNFQPVAFTGAASDDDVRKSRITIPDVLAAIESQMGGILKKDDFYPVPCVLPFSDLVEAYTGRPQVRFTAHQHCGAATYVFVQKDSVIPVNRMVDVESFFESITQMAETIKKGGTINKYKALLEGVKNMHRLREERRAGQHYRVLEDDREDPYRAELRSPPRISLECPLHRHHALHGPV